MRALILFVLAAVASARAEQLTFKVHAELVRIDVLAEESGRPMVGLAADDSRSRTTAFRSGQSLA